jgi:hypothetical protein
MSTRALAASAIAAMSLAGVSPVAAADLDYPDYSYSETERYTERSAHYGNGENDRYDDRAGCLPRHAIRERLRDEGWRDIQKIDSRGGEVIVTAERPNGKIYDLKVDRCSGEIIDSRVSREVYGEYRPTRYRGGYDYRD